MAKDPMLGLEEWKLLCGRDGCQVWEVQSGEGVLAASGVPWILSESQRCTAGSGAENFAHVIKSTAIGVSSAYSKLFEKIVGAELGLQSVIVGETAIVALQHKAFSAAGSAQRGICCLSRAKQHLWTGTDNKSRAG